MNFNNGYGLASAGKLVMNDTLHGKTGTMRSNMVDGAGEKGERARMVGSTSKTSVTWVNGPTHNIRN